MWGVKEGGERRGRLVLGTERGGGGERRRRVGAEEVIIFALARGRKTMCMGFSSSRRSYVRQKASP